MNFVLTCVLIVLIILCIRLAFVLNRELKASSEYVSNPYNLRHYVTLMLKRVENEPHQLLDMHSELMNTLHDVRSRIPNADLQNSVLRRNRR